MVLAEGGAEELSWDIRIKIAIGAARGLAMLHTTEKTVIYRDFKASNILLDKVIIINNKLFESFTIIHNSYLSIFRISMQNFPILDLRN